MVLFLYYFTKYKFLFIKILPNYASPLSSEALPKAHSFTKNIFMNTAKTFIISCLCSLLLTTSFAQTNTFYGYYSVKPGDYLSRIAENFGVTVNQLRDWNGLEGNYLKAGQKLRVTPPSRKVQMRSEFINSPNNIGTRSVNVANTGFVTRTIPNSPTVVASRSVSGPVGDNWIAHRIQKGETLLLLSDRYGVTIEELIRYNNLKSNVIKAGKILLIMPYSFISSSGVSPSVNVNLISTPFTDSRGISNSMVPVTTILEPNATNNTIISPAPSVNNFSQRSIPTNQVGNPFENDMRVYQYVVRKGDNLFEIAKEFGVKKESIQAINQLSGNTIQVGETLWIPVM